MKPTSLSCVIRSSVKDESSLLARNFLYSCLCLVTQRPSLKRNINQQAKVERHWAARSHNTYQSLFSYMNTYPGVSTGTAQSPCFSLYSMSSVKRRLNVPLKNPIPPQGAIFVEFPSSMFKALSMLNTDASTASKIKKIISLWSLIVVEACGKFTTGKQSLLLQFCVFEALLG